MPIKTPKKVVVAKELNTYGTMLVAVIVLGDVLKQASAISMIILSVKNVIVVVESTARVTASRTCTQREMRTNALSENT